MSRVAWTFNADHVRFQAVGYIDVLTRRFSIMSYVQNDKGQWQCENCPAPMCENHGASMCSKKCTCPVGPIKAARPRKLDSSSHVLKPSGDSRGLGIIEVRLRYQNPVDRFWRHYKLWRYRMAGLYRANIN